MAGQSDLLADVDDFLKVAVGAQISNRNLYESLRFDFVLITAKLPNEISPNYLMKKRQIT